MVTRERTSRVLRLTVTVSTGLALAVCGASLADAVTGAAKTTVNIRSGPGTSHEIEGGLVRGQRITVTRKAKDGWVRVSFAGSRAYIAADYVDTTVPKPAPPKRIKTSGTKITTETVNVRSGPGKSYDAVGSLSAGSRIRLTGPQRAGFAQLRYAGHIRWVSVTYLAKSGGSGGGGGPVGSEPPRTSAAKGRAALAFARRQLGKPYQFGAEGPDRYDCSGLVLAAWRTVGVSMPRTAAQQYEQGHKISRSSLRAGDLVFFYSQQPHHVGMYVAGGRIIDAPRPGMTVRYTTISHMPYSGAVRPG